MITTVRIEASGDTPDQVKSQIDSALARIGLGLGEVTDEVYERAPKNFGYQGRMKVNYEVPMNSKEEKLYNDETDQIVELVNGRLAQRAGFSEVTFSGVPDSTGWSE